MQLIFTVGLNYMNKIDRIGMIGAFVGFASLVYILANGSSLNMIHWPIEALSGLAFSFAWGFGVPVLVAYVFAVIIFIAVMFIGSSLGRIVAKKILNVQ